MSLFTNPAAASREHADAYIAGILHALGDRDAFRVLETTPADFARLIDGLTAAELRAPEGSGKWSLQQVLAHMADSEVVWSLRLRMVLTHDRPPLTGYDQDLWAERLGYGETDTAQSLRVFAVLRESNLRLLRRATPADLQRFGVHAERGEESVQHMIRLYAGHDIVHLRQLERIRDVVTRRESRPPRQ
ncbi:MAG TPA: DinB family protein [Gemmatimonadaceae bacterium]|nr:DinB family protein [Gemmatimonadaceae bacterium]